MHAASIDACSIITRCLSLPKRNDKKGLKMHFLRPFTMTQNTFWVSRNHIWWKKDLKFSQMLSVRLWRGPPPFQSAWLKISRFGFWEIPLAGIWKILISDRISYHQGIQYIKHHKARVKCIGHCYHCLPRILNNSGNFDAIFSHNGRSYDKAFVTPKIFTIVVWYRREQFFCELYHFPKILKNIIIIMYRSINQTYYYEHINEANW